MGRSSLSRRRFLKLSLFAVLDSILIASGSFTYADFLEPGWIQTTLIQLSFRKLKSEFNGFKIIHISDIHIGTWINKHRLDDIVTTINSHSPNIVAITGDFVYQNAKTVSRILNDANIIELSNQVHIIEKSGLKLSVAGIDDVWENKHRLDQVTQLLPEDSAVILLAHEPDIAEFNAITGHFDLQLSGHSHGGQDILPGAPLLPPLGIKYPLGLYEIDSMFLYTNRGVGVTPPIIRFNCRPEITVIELLAM